LSFLPHDVAAFAAELISGTLIAPFIAIVVTLVYFRLTSLRDKPSEPAAQAPGTPGEHGTPGEQL
jgi:hypothetical protein